MNPYLATLIVVVNAAIFTHFDAARLRDSFHIGVGPRGIPPHSWAALVFLFLPVALPYYLVVARGTAKQAAMREGPPPRFTARDLNVWGYVASVAFLGLAVFLGLTGRFSWAALAGLCMVAGLFGGRKAVQEEGKGFELGGAAWDMSGFRLLEDDRELDDDAVTAGADGYVPPLSDGGGNVRPKAPSGSGVGSGVGPGLGPAEVPSPGTSSGGIDVFSPPKRTGPAPPSGPSSVVPPVTADAAPLAAMSASSDEDDDVWDPVRADEEAQRARTGSEDAPGPAQPPSIQPPGSRPMPDKDPKAPQPAPPVDPRATDPSPPDPHPPHPSRPDPSGPHPSRPDPKPADSPSPAATRPMSAQNPLPDLQAGPQDPPAPTPPPPPPPSAAPPPVDLGEELPPGLVDDDEPVSLVDDDLAPFELAPDEDDEEELPESLIDDEDDEDLDLLAPLPPLANLGSPRPAAARPGSRPDATRPAPPRTTPGPGAAPGGRDAQEAGSRPPSSRPRPAAPTAGGYVGKASSSGPPAVLIWFTVIAVILGGAWWIGTRNDGAVDEILAEVMPPPAEEVVEEPAEPAVDRAAAAEEAMRRQMNEWIATYDSVMRPIADLVEEIDFDTLGRGNCLELQRLADKANSQLRVAPDGEVELLLRPAFKALIEAGRACSSKNEIEWSINLLQAKDHTHETQLLLDERYRYVGPFELEQEEALGHQRSLETISGRYLAGELDAQQSDD